MLVRDYKSATTPIRSLAGFNFAKRELLILAGVLFLAASIKIALLLVDAVPFNSDEAVVALMARHILHGERPVFYYGQAYMGSLDAWLVSAAFKLVGEGLTAVRAVQSVLYLLYIFTVWLLARAFFTEKRIALFAAICSAVPTVLVTTYTTASLGGYGETLVMGNLILFLAYQIVWGNWRFAWLAWFGLGLLGGLAFWTLGMSLVYLLPACVLLVWRFNYRLGWQVVLCMAGFILGSSPWWGYNLSHGWAALRMLLEAQAGETTMAEHLISLVVVGLPTLFGLRYPWSVQLSPLPVLSLSVLLYIMAAVYLLWNFKHDRTVFSPGTLPLLTIYALIFSLVFLFTRFGIDATGRYLLPLNLLVVLSLALLVNGAWQRRPILGAALLVLILAVNAYETWRAASLPELITTQVDPVTRFDNTHDAELAAFLSQHGESRGYSSYWVSFRLAFLTQEKLLFAAELPYKPDLTLSPGDNRYPAYARQAAESDQVAYITSLHPNLDVLLKERFSEHGVLFNEEQIGPYHVYYNLSRAVSPGDLGLEFPAR